MKTCIMCMEHMTYDDLCDSCEAKVKGVEDGINFLERASLGQDLDGDTIDIKKLIKKGEIQHV